MPRASKERTLRRKAVVLFIGITLGASVSAALIFEYVIEPGEREAEMLLVLAVAFVPAASAVLVQRFVLKERFRPTEFSIGRSTWPYLFLAVAYVPILMFTAFKFGALFARQYVLTSSVEPLAKLLVEALFVLVVAVVLAFGEELGWRSFLQPRLNPTRPLVAALGTGLVWAVWHFPFYIWGPYFLEQKVYAGLVYLVTLLPKSIIYGFLRERTGTVWAPAVAHASYNTVIGFPLLTTIATDASFYGLFWVVALVIIFSKKLQPYWAARPIHEVAEAT